MIREVAYEMPLAQNRRGAHGRAGRDDLGAGGRTAGRATRLRRVDRGQPARRWWRAAQASADRAEMDDVATAAALDDADFGYEGRAGRARGVASRATGRVRRAARRERQRQDHAAARPARACCRRSRAASSGAAACASATCRSARRSTRSTRSRASTWRCWARARDLPFCRRAGARSARRGARGARGVRAPIEFARQRYAHALGRPAPAHPDRARARDEPELLLLDEPTAGVDPETERAILDVLARAARASSGSRSGW